MRTESTVHCYRPAARCAACLLPMSDERQPSKGTYLLLARLDVTTDLTIGRLGKFTFPAGWYAYAGSARGPGGIQARLARHRRSSKRLHWHIDYLLQVSHLEKSWTIECTVRPECAWAAAVGQLPGALIAVPRFGASDCRCPGHLINFPTCPSDRQISDALRIAAKRAGLLPSQPIRCNVYGTSTIADHRI